MTNRETYLAICEQARELREKFRKEFKALKIKAKQSFDLWSEEVDESYNNRCRNSYGCNSLDAEGYPVPLIFESDFEFHAKKKGYG